MTRCGGGRPLRLPANLSSGEEKTVMIDRFRSLARAIGGLAKPSLVLALGCLAYAVFVVLTSTSREGDRFLFPSILGFAWALSLYGFIETFKYVPEPLAGSPGFVQRTRHKLSRSWYWVVALVFLGMSLGVLVLTLRTLSVWFSSYGAG
jgi:hypothetical protein